MRLVTLQPNTVLETLGSGEDYRPATNFHEKYEIFEKNPIFCMPLESTRQFLADAMLTCAGYPQSIVVFDSEEYTGINKIGWNKYILSDDSSDVYADGVQEYVVHEIKANDFIGGRSISVWTPERSMDTCDSDVIYALEMNRMQGAAIDFITTDSYRFINKCLPKEKRENIRVNLDTMSNKNRAEFVSLVERINLGTDNVYNEELVKFMTETINEIVTPVE